MDGVAVINFDGNLGTYLTQGTAVSNKAAKLNDKKENPGKNTKKEQLVSNWLKLRPNVAINTDVQNIGTKKEANVSDILASLGITPMEFRLDDFIANGKRKIKTVEKVPNGARKVNRESEKEIVEKVVMASQEEVPVPTRSRYVEEKETSLPKEEPFRTPEFAPISETRTQRLERTGEIPKVSTPVINAPERFAMPEPKFEPTEESSVQQDFYGNQTPSRSRMERNINDYQEREESVDNKLELGKMEKDLNRIASINHSSDVSDTSNEALRMAYENYEKSERAKQAVKLETNRLMEEYDNLKRELYEQNAKQIADLNARTQANKEEVMGYTVNLDSLRQQIEEIKRQRAENASSFKR